MLAVIACPGPSLLTADIPPCDLLIGVNRAPVILESRGIRVATWAACDVDRLSAHAPTYPVDVCASKGAILRAHKRPNKFGCQVKAVTTYEDLEPQFPRVWKWMLYTFPAAIVYAAFKGATVIECIGCDMTNAPDADGVNLASNRRTDQRWAQERAIFEELVLQLGRRGVSVKRIGHEAGVH